MSFYSPLRYPGGKGKISNFMKEVFEKNLLCDGYYVEPYAGGSSVALSLLLNEYVTKIIINDVDRSIYAIWYSVINRTEEFCELISKTKVNLSTWKHQKEIQKKKERCSLLDLGFSTFFLNRTNRSGIIKGGVIGGIDQSGNWKIDARFNKEDLIKRIRNIAAYKSRIKIYNLDACQLVRQISKSVPKKTLFYFDPPYYFKGKELYENHYKQEDHVSVASLIRRIKRHKWIVSYDYAPDIIELYKDHRQLKYTVNYSARTVRKGSEVMIFSDNLVIPKTKNPTKPT